MLPIGNGPLVIGEGQLRVHRMKRLQDRVLGSARRHQKADDFVQRASRQDRGQELP
jgi:hypothetical protein